MHSWTFLVLALFGTCVFGQEVSQATQTAAASANADFAFNLLRKLSTENKNVFFSPMSISAAIGMTSLGARGNTLTEIDSAFYFNRVKSVSNDPMAIHEVFQKIITLYGEESTDYSLSIANRLYGQEGFQILPEFLEQTKEYYKASLQQLNFSDGTAEGIINQWVSDQTHGKIKDLFAPGSLSADTVLALVNAIYFKGTWKTKFNVEDTRDMDFHMTETTKKTVKMMSVTKTFPYYEDPVLNVQVLEMPYSGDNLSMIVILPQQGGLQNLVNNLNSSKIDELIGNLISRKVNVKFPKFKLETEYSLKDTLVQLGVNDLFSNRADMRNISMDPVMVSKVIHKAFIQVDEKGTRAAAATGVTLERVLTIESPTAEFIMNKPFVYVIIDNTLQSMGLFYGIVHQP